MENFINNFKPKSRHHSKLINFIYPELRKINNSNILEFGVSEKAMSTEMFLEHCKSNNCKLYSIDNVDYGNKFDDDNWKFILSRDDEFDIVEKSIEKNFDLILLDTIHESKHVKKILYHYYKLLKVGKCFFIDDISWLPYVKTAEKNRFYAEVNNSETFQTLLEIYFFNINNFRLEFSFEGTGMCKIVKLNKNNLNDIKFNLPSRKYSVKNILRKILKS